MSRIARVAGAMLLAAMPAPLQAQEVPQASAAEQVAAAREAAAAPEAVPACKPRKKRGFGLGSILKAASRTGLTNMVGGGLLGYGGAVASTAINTGVSVAEGSKAKPEPAADGC
jgi:hypothetical protein